MTEGMNLIDRLKERKGRESRCQSIATRFTRKEELLLTSAAERDGMNLREWAREVLLREARRPKDDVLLTETIATRILLLNLLKPLARGQKISEEYITDLIVKVRTEKREATLEILEQYAAAERLGS